MQENIELKTQDKIQLKTISAQQMEHMKDLILSEAHDIINNNEDIPRTKREENRTSLIISIEDGFKAEIKNYCNLKDVRIRDFWVECVHRIIRRYNNDR